MSSPPTDVTPTALLGVSTPAIDVDLFCPQCGYNLRRSSSDRCPECGQAIDRKTLGESNIPWLARRTIGRPRAYWRTVRLVLRHPARVGREGAKPILFAETIGFRRATVGILMATALAIAGSLFVIGEFDFPIDLGDFAPSINLGGGLAMSPRGIRLMDVYVPLIAGWSVWVVAPIYVLLFLLALVGVGGYWLHPASLPIVRQNRAVALGNFACAPLALVPVAVVLLGLTLFVGNNVADNPDGGYGWAALLIAIGVTTVGVFIAAVVMFYTVTLKIIRHATNASAGRLLTAAMVLPLSWLLLAVLTLALLPWVVGFYSLVFVSFV